MKKLITIFPVVSGIMWGSAGIFVRTLTNLGMDAYTVVSTRVIVAVAIMLIWLGISGKEYLKIKILTHSFLEIYISFMYIEIYNI